MRRRDDDTRPRIETPVQSARRTATMALAGSTAIAITSLEGVHLQSAAEAEQIAGLIARALHQERESALTEAGTQRKKLDQRLAEEVSEKSATILVLADVQRAYRKWRLSAREESDAEELDAMWHRAFEDARRGGVL